MRKSVKPLRALSTILALTAVPARADSGVGVDTWLANKFDPTGGTLSQIPDENGTSWLVAGMRRTPTGNLLLDPAEPPPVDEYGGWLVHGVVQLGGTVTSGDDRNKLWNRYVHWGNGFVAQLDLQAERSEDGSYAELRGSRLSGEDQDSDDDQYYEAVFGRAGSYKIEAFLRDLPNVVSSNAKPIWNGVGTNRLTLVPALTPGASTSAQVGAVSAATPERSLSVERKKLGLGFDVYLSPEWTAYAKITDEKRSGERPYGGSFFFNFPFAGNGGILETVKPIDDFTINLNGGLRYAGEVWRLDLGYSGSFYRDRFTRFTFETPFALYPVVPGAVSAPLTTGQYSTEPDNDYHNVRATATRKVPLDGEVSLTASAGRMSQNDTLIAPVDCKGVFGIGLNGSLQLGPQNPFLMDCANWNTPNALSRPTANMSIDTMLVDGRVVLRPTPDVSVRGAVRFNREDYRNVYIAFNPLTGQYGFVNESGSQGSVVPGESGIFDPRLGPSTLTRVQSLPLDKQTTDVEAGADWSVSENNTIGVTYAFQRYEPTHRERSRIDDNSIKLTGVNRSLKWLTLRLNYTYLNQSGNAYEYDPYAFTYSNSLPGYVPPPTGTPSHTVDAMRKYDMSSRDQNKVDMMATFIPRNDMTLSASLRGDWNAYDAQIGRQAYNTYGATLQWEWQPLPATGVSLYAAWDGSRLAISNVQDLQGGAGSDPTLGGANYALQGQWWLRDAQRDYYAGATLTHTVRGMRFDAGWNFIYAKGNDDYAYASAVALAYPDTAPNSGPGGGSFPATSYQLNSFTFGVTIQLTERLSLRLFDNYEIGRVSDWHYTGFNASRVYDHRVYVDGGPTDYSANVVGALVNIRL
jgi:hypothetical protein